MQRKVEQLKKAIWIPDYDFHSDKTYICPGCADCREPIIQKKNGKCFCISCEEETVPDDKMKKWLEERSRTKIEWEDCLICEGKRCVETNYVVNKVTLEWQEVFGNCRRCGASFIV